VYTPRITDATYNYKFMVLSSDKQTVYLGSYTVNKLNITNKTFTTIAGLTSYPYRGASDGLGTMASFNAITGAALWQNESYLLAVDMSNCNVRLVNLSSNASFPVSTLAGSKTQLCGLIDGVGTAARFRYPLDIALDPSQATAYISDAGNNVIRTINLTSLAVATVAGNGGASNFDGIGTAASITPMYLAVAPDGHALYVKTTSGIRRVDLATFAVTTAASTLGQSPYQLAAGAGLTTLYYTSNYRVSAFFLPSGQTFHIAGGAAAGSRDGVGADALFQAPGLIVVVGETRAPGALCAVCTVCPAGQFGTCNASASECFPCPAGFTSRPGASACFPCAAGSYSVGGLCVQCPPGSSSENGSTACTNCTAGTFKPRGSPACLNCSAGTFSAGAGATACGQCTNLTGNGTWSGPGTNSSNCAYACRAGFNLVVGTGLCSACGAGTYAAPGSAVCSPCTNLPDNANHTGVGANATSCPFACQPGFISNGTACLPCPAGSRMRAGVCVNCTAGSYGLASASVCLACSQGNYSLPGASACTVCSNAGPYNIFVGRGTSPRCQFVCKAGSFLSLVNRTCLPCANGTYSGAGAATACKACGVGTWSEGGASACSNCTALEITAAYSATSIADFPYIARDGFGVTGIVCVA